MSRPCTNCGATCAAEARFCRLCGAPLKQAGSPGTPVSPGAVTVPLSDEGRTTNGLSTEDGSASAPETARVRRAEMESILRRSAPTPTSLPETNNSQAFKEREAAASDAVPPTTSLGAGRADGQSVLQEAAKAEPVAADGAHQGEASATGESTSSGGAQAAAPKKTNAGAPHMWKVAAIALLVVAVGAAALAFYYSSGTGTRDAQETGPISISDQQRLVQEKLSEAESLLAAGNVTDAIARLRYAIRLEPSNARAHRLLAEALERTGAVNEAIDEYRLAAQNDPGNEDTLLRYADALRRVGRVDEARDVYQKLSSSSSAEVSRTAKEQLAQLASSTASNSDSSREARTQNREDENAANSNGSAPQTQAGSTAPPASSGSGGAARPKSDPVASYNTAMKIIEGKDIRKMNRAELIRAYELFQYAQAGPNAADANRRLRELDRELFERRKRRQ